MMHYDEFSVQHMMQMITCFYIICHMLEIRTKLLRQKK